MHRAVRLSVDQELEDSVDGISEQALIEAAAELGVDISVVQQAAVEERLGLLVQRTQRGDALVGPAVVTVSRIVPGGPEEVLESVDSWLRRTGSLRRQRTGELSSKYSQRTDLAASAERTARSLMGTEELSRLPRLSVSTTAAAPSNTADGPSTLVALSADLQAERSAWIAAGAGVAILGSALALYGVVAAAAAAAAAANESAWGDVLAGVGLAALCLLGIPVSCALGFGILSLRARRISGVEDSLEGILDQVATGDLPVSKFTKAAQRFLRTLTRGSTPRSGPRA